MKWNELTSPRIASLDRDIPIVIPLASCEQHGRHLPVFVDTMQAAEIADRVEREMTGRIVMVPPLWLGASHHHRDFAGTISLPPKLYAEVIQELARNFLRQGFRRLFFLNAHGGNQVPTSHALTDLIATDDQADAASIGLAMWWVATAAAITPETHGMTTPKMTHACEYETSLMLAIRGDLVHLEELDPAHIEVPRPWTVDPRWAGRVEGFHRFHRWTSSGHMGDPSTATKEKGQSLLDAVTGALVTFLDDFAKWPVMPALGPKQRTPQGETGAQS